ncbi:MAG: hypothetical protein O7G85_05735 [Planctomycetota bacterium]|nr:hypothetical protein [Planctomycetota bacterium]
MFTHRFTPKPFITIMILLSMMMTSCASDALTGGIAAGEPMLIALRNSSGRRLDSMTVQDKDQSIGEPIRLGSISPVMDGRTYTFMRRENPPRLPDEAVVIYVHRRSGTHRVTVRLREALKNSTGHPSEALIFDLQSTGQVHVYVDVVLP